MNTKLQAEKSARKLLKQVKLMNKKTLVWENLGWHYEVVGQVGLAVLHVYPSGDDQFHCLLGTGSGGDMRWSQRPSFKNPNEAILDTLTEAKRVLEDELKFFVQMQMLVPYAL